MENKFWFIAIAMILITGLAFAVPSVTSNVPILNQDVYGGRTVTIDFNLIDQNLSYNSATPAEIKIYYSTVAGERQTLIVSDTNLLDQTTILCEDINFYVTRDCNYTWTIPTVPTMGMGNFYIDYNYSPYDAGAYTNYFESSDRFNVVQPMPNSMAAMIALALFIIAAGLAVVAVMMLGKDDFTIDKFIMTVIAVIVLIVVGWTLYGTMVVPGV